MNNRRLACLPIALASCLLAQNAFCQSTVTFAKSVGHALAASSPDPQMPMQVTLWLKLKNREALEGTLQQLYDPKSSQYHRWLGAADLAQYEPTPADVAAVKAELQSHGLTLAADDPNRLSVRARGTLAQMQSAFHTQIGAYQRDGRLIYANTTDASLDGQAGELTLAVSGLDNLAGPDQASSKPLVRPRQTPVPLQAQGAPSSLSAQAQGTGDLSNIITDRCFQPAMAVTVGTTSQPPYGTWTGEVFDSGSLLCGYDAAGLSAAYGVTEAHERGLRGQGQTIVLMEFYDSPTILDDVNAFSKLNHLPPLTSSNFAVVYPDGKPAAPVAPGTLPTFETPLDVEWAHAMAPEANIVLMIPPTPADEEIQYGIYYAAMNRLGGVLSINFSEPEILSGAYTAQAYDQMLALAAASGIAVNISAGESAPPVQSAVLGNPNLPASSPHATAVGGTSRIVPSGADRATEIGWSNWGVALDEGVNFNGSSSEVPIPPSQFGVGLVTAGGESVFFPKPSYQASLPCSTGRCVPDIAALGDGSFSGGLLVYTDPTAGEVVTTFGGTGMSSAIFSGIWALANQRAGHWLGQAAPALSRMRPEAIHDILPFGIENNVTGTFVDATDTATSYSATEMFSTASLPVPAQFVSALFSGTDSSGTTVWALNGWGFVGALTVTPGWDYMTGYGTPNGMALIDAAAYEGGVTRSPDK